MKVWPPALFCYHPPLSAFSLSKWYMDVVSDDGDPFLAYHAELRWHALRIHYASVLDGAWSLGSTPAPEMHADRVSWNVPALQLSGDWTGGAAAVSEEVLDGVVWNCVRPCANACVETGGRKLAGLGYAERLTLTRAPWSLGIAELRWGRFLSATDWLVWIHLTGEHSKAITIHNGRHVEADALESLELTDSRVLRDGALGQTALSIVPGADGLFPASVLGIEETKWRSRGVLRREGRAAEGWAIHEVVRWT